MNQVTENILSDVVCDLINRHTGADDYSKAVTIAAKMIPRLVDDVVYPGLGRFWSNLAIGFIELVLTYASDTEELMTLFNFEKDIDSKLVIKYVGGNEIIRGFADLYEAYANHVDEETGQPLNT